MTHRSYREESRSNWGLSNDAQPMTIERINCGAILRIADATEKMAKRYTEAIDDRNYWEQRAKRAERALDTERRRTAALRGVVKQTKEKDAHQT